MPTPASAAKILISSAWTAAKNDPEGTLKSLKRGIKVGQELVDILKEAMGMKAMAEEMERTMEAIQGINVKLDQKSEEIKNQIAQTQKVIRTGMNEAVTAVLAIERYTKTVQKWAKRVLESEESDIKNRRFTILLEKYKEFCLEASSKVKTARGTLLEALEGVQSIDGSLQGALNSIEFETRNSSERKREIENNRSRPLSGLEDAATFSLQVGGTTALITAPGLAIASLPFTIVTVPIGCAALIAAAFGAQTLMEKAAEPKQVALGLRQFCGEDVSEEVLLGLINQISRLKEQCEQFKKHSTTLSLIGDHLKAGTDQLLLILETVRAVETTTGDLVGEINRDCGSKIILDFLDDLVEEADAVVVACSSFLDNHAMKRFY